VAENAADAGGVGWWATWTLILMVLALIGIALARRARDRPSGDEATLDFTILTFGGPALLLLTQVFFLRNVLEYVRAPGCGTGGACDACLRHRAAHANRWDRGATETPILSGRPLGSTRSRLQVNGVWGMGIQDFGFLLWRVHLPTHFGE
jgi:hypothetical protein